MYVYVYEYVCMYVCIAIVTFRSFHTKESELHPNIIHIYPDKVVSLLKFTSIIQQLIITCKHCNKNKNQIDRNKIELRRNTYYVCAYTVILHGHDCHDLTFTSRESIDAIRIAAIRGCSSWRIQTRFRLLKRIT